MVKNYVALMLVEVDQSWFRELWAKNAEQSRRLNTSTYT
jgi:hypothetical protein